MLRTSCFLPLRLGINGLLKEGNVGDGTSQSRGSIPLVRILDVDINLHEMRALLIRRSFPVPIGTQD